MSIICRIIYKYKKVVDFLLCVRAGRVSEWCGGDLKWNIEFISKYTGKNNYQCVEYEDLELINK